MLCKRTFPANSKFRPKQKFIYETVLKANRTVLNAIKPGVSWIDIHLLTEELRSEGLVQGDLELLIEERIGASRQFPWY